MEDLEALDSGRRLMRKGVFGRRLAGHMGGGGNIDGGACMTCLVETCLGCNMETGEGCEAMENMEPDTEDLECLFETCAGMDAETTAMMVEMVEAEMEEGEEDDCTATCTSTPETCDDMEDMLTTGCAKSCDTDDEGIQAFYDELGCDFDLAATGDDGDGGTSSAAVLLAAAFLA